MKRLFDLTVSLAVLLPLSPVLFSIAMIIKLNDKGPVFYRGLRTGRYGKSFRILKFRTMVLNSENIGGSSTSDSDPRITGIGRFLRKCKLDELPQLFNVLNGEMSIVGPRPEVKQYTDLYSAEEKRILTVRPGITDWASIWNSDEGAILARAEDPDRAYMELIRPTKLRLQMKYVNEQSFLTDVKIIWLTICALLQPRSAAVEEIVGKSDVYGRKQDISK